MKKLMIPIIIVAALAIGAVVMYIILGGGGDGEPVVKPEVMVDYSPGSNFVVNLKDPSKTVRVEMLFKVVQDDTVLDYLAAENARIRDTIIFILRELTYEEARADNVKAILTERLVGALNEELGIENFREVLFTDFVTS